MRILHVVTLISPDRAYGGPVTVALNQAVELTRRGHEVTVCAATRGYEVVPTERSGVDLRLFPAIQLIPKAGFAGLTSVGLIRWVYAHLDSFDVVHVHLARDLVTMPIARLASLRSKRVLSQTHGMILPDSRFVARVFDRFLTRPVLRSVAVALCLNQREVEAVQQVDGSDLRCVELPNGVAFVDMRISTASESREILFVGRLQKRKNAPVFVAAAKLLIGQGSTARFTLVGPDEGDGPGIREAIRGEHQIQWIGALEPDQVLDKLREAAVYVLPAVDEPFPMTVLEAMAVGLPVVITRSCGLAGLVTVHDAGLVVDPTPRDVADAIDELLDDPERARDMGTRGRSAVRSRLSIETVAAELIDLYR
ncbi:glycosyltransferase [Rhodococcus sp. IEGM 1381]|uniref:glycosyltransferase n=1 Tax=Rhodococcus sp. IEGM 1381 TaxID=3047085 RepID=UPI0024B7BBE7|nr:glycosyltransferase [Rhodococcus sp. IEGM 1381]MDI9894241.1 glycosyltransferase [Rhodococcus sp. IEGM 1381]